MHASSGHLVLVHDACSVSHCTILVLYTIYTIFCLKCIWVPGMCPEPRWIDYPAPRQLTVSQWPDQSDIACYGPVHPHHHSPKIAIIFLPYMSIPPPSCLACFLSKPSQMCCPDQCAYTCALVCVRGCV